ncbi:hypothetical protein [Vibrio spartinae]|uniref:Uncharacterized protein n=1 Tax=Vibrio spartinae TaxID=1918945 RepID=A0A1N6MB08_9VIBR|nr:hypothetical protein [Vibrio spartinae]SIO96632.1 hypothetical protein VSP9026_04435 [Vibrio spartinae]
MKDTGKFRLIILILTFTTAITTFAANFSTLVVNYKKTEIFVLSITERILGKGGDSVDESEENSFPEVSDGAMSGKLKYMPSYSSNAQPSFKGNEEKENELNPCRFGFSSNTPINCLFEERNEK